MKVYYSFKDNIWGAELGDMQLISKYNNGIKLKVRKALLSVVNAFKSLLNYSKGKPNQRLVDQSSKFIADLLKHVKSQWYRDVFNT